MKAETKPTTADCGAAIARLRQIAAESGNHLLLGDGPPHPDAKLLDLCAEIGEQRKAADTASEEWRSVPWARRSDEAREVYQLYETAKFRLRHLLREAGKLRATTGAGIYAKALAVTHARTDAQKLGWSLARDLLDNPALRILLWKEERP